ncbi:hypothetical protein TELCIR_12788 [Teladorsagia circumcincta]|uniref:Costars domain-containing protein n=1 Tax=Teladorsagia circumcincta TaxID=45464 RepID=A0A2G9U5U1_TELCI|nr:hypothetical protein TELCIR_12788 [Teladorsagia circumcincta]
MSARETIKRFNAVAAKADEELKKNPYSDSYQVPQYDKNSSDYGRPPPGSKTEARGIRAGVHVCREILFLCEIINENAEGEEPHKWIKFGKLFYVYAFYSDKVPSPCSSAFLLVAMNMAAGFPQPAWLQDTA